MNPIGLNRHRGAFVRYSGLRPRRDRVDLQFRLSHRIRRILQSGMRMCSEQDLAARSHVRVLNMKTGRSITVTINDRGPYVRGDLTPAAARALGVHGRGRVRVAGG